MKSLQKLRTVACGALIAGALAVVLLQLSVFYNAVRAADDPPAAANAEEPAPLEPEEARELKAIAALKKESLEDSLERLCLIATEGFPGALRQDLGPFAFPLRSGHGTDDIRDLMRNRRLLKVYEELAALPKPKASVLVHRHLQVALKEYNRMYDEKFPLDGNRPMGGMTFQIGDDGTVEHATFLGRRTQVLGLVLLAGNLQLKEVDTDVMAVVQRGINQYAEMRNSTKYDMPIAVMAVTMASLYSPGTLAVGLMGTAPNEEAPIVRQYQQQLKNAKLAPFTRVRGKFDRAPPPKDTIELRYLSDPEEDELQKIIDAVTPR